MPGFFHPNVPAYRSPATVLSYRLGGIMIWELGQALYQGSQPLLQAQGTSSGAEGAITLQPEVASEFSACDSYQNALKLATDFSYRFPAASDVSLKIFDVLGREAPTLADVKKRAGLHMTKWNASEYAGEIHFSGLTVNTQRGHSQGPDKWFLQNGIGC